MPVVHDGKRWVYFCDDCNQPRSHGSGKYCKLCYKKRSGPSKKTGPDEWRFVERAEKRLARCQKYGDWQPRDFKITQELRPVGDVYPDAADSPDMAPLWDSMVDSRTTDPLDILIAIEEEGVTKEFFFAE
jgi:hypothetical protein